MRGNRGFQVSQYRIGHTSLAAVLSIFEDLMFHLTQYWEEKVFVSLDQALVRCEMMDPSTSRSVRVAWAVSMKINYGR